MRYWIPLILFTLVFSVEAKQREHSKQRFISPSPYDYRYKGLRISHFLAHMEIYQEYPDQLDHLSVHFPSLHPDEYANYVAYLLNIAEESGRAKRRGLKEIYCSPENQYLNPAGLAALKLTVEDYRHRVGQGALRQIIKDYGIAVYAETVAYMQEVTEDIQVSPDREHENIDGDSYVQQNCLRL